MEDKFDDMAVETGPITKTPCETKFTHSPTATF